MARAPPRSRPPARFADFRDRVARTRVLVVGDVMLDRYWFGEVERISPEAPVPVVKIARSEERPGGAANVARNAAALGASLTLLSVIGADEPGAMLERLLAADRVRTLFHRDPSVATTVKLRVIGRQQQLLRIDFETTPSHEVLAGKLADYDRLLARQRRGRALGLRKRRARAHRDDDRAGAGGRQAGPRRSEGRRLDQVSRRDADHAEPQRIPRSRRALARRGAT